MRQITNTIIVGRRWVAQGMACCPGFVASCWLAYKRMDDLPEPVQVFLHALMRRRQSGAPAIATSIPLSKHIAYKLDTW